jgi:hypothetical protein
VKAAEQQAQRSTDPVVLEDLKQVQHDDAQARRLTGSPPVSREQLNNRVGLRSTAMSLLILSLTTLQKVLKVRTKGKEFVDRFKGKSTVETATAYIKHMTPEVLMHNVPEFEELKSSLADFERASAEEQRDRNLFTQFEQQSKLVLDELALSVDVLECSLKREAKRAARRQLGPMSGKPSSKKAA